MKTIGLIGGMSWESTAVYYKLINQKTKQILGGSHFCKSVMISVDFVEIANLQHSGDWEDLSIMMNEIALKLEKAGADCVVLCTNTMHKVTQDFDNLLSIPFLHIADATAEAIVAKKMQKVALLGTKFTMEENFLKGRMFEKYGIECIIPNENQRKIVNNVIYNELVNGIINNDSRNQYLSIIDELVNQGAEGIILGCTKIGLLITSEFTGHQLFDTTEIHADYAIRFALEN